MAHKKSREVAYDSFVVQRRTQKESARLAGITPKTMSDWVTKYKWKERRDALLSSAEQGLENLTLILNLKTERLLELERDPKSDPKEKFNLSNEIIGLRKSKNEFEKKNKIPYEVFVTVSDKIMSNILIAIPEKKTQILDFFENLLIEEAERL